MSSSRPPLPSDSHAPPTTARPDPLPDQSSLGPSQADLRLALAAVRRARQRAEWAADRLARLQAVTAALNATRAPADVADVLLDLGLTALGASGGGVFVLDHDAASLRPLRLTGYPPTSASATTGPATGAAWPITDAACRSAPVTLISPVERAARYPHLAGGPATDGGTLIAVPLRVAERVVGGWEIWLPEERQLTDDELAFLLALAGQGAQALERTRLQATEHHLRARLEALAEASQAIATAGLDLRALQGTIVRRAVDLLGDQSLMRLLSPDGCWLDLVALYHPDPARVAATRALVATVRYQASEGMLSRVIATGEPLRVPVVTAELLRAAAKPEYQEFLIQHGLHSLMIVPLRARGRVLGTLSLTRDTPGRPYTADDLIWFQDLADRAAVALDHARLFAEVEASEERQRLALTAANASLWERDLITDTLWWSPAHYALIGRDPAAGPLTLDDWLPLVHPHDRARLAAARAVITTDHPPPVDYRIMHPDGEIRWLTSRAWLVRDATGQPTRLVGIVLDITERKQAELALQVTEDRLRVAIRNLPMVVSHADRDLRYTWIHNPDSLPQLAALLGKRDDDLIPPDQAAPVLALKRRVLEEGRGVRGEISVLVGGRRQTWELTIEPLRDEAGAVVGVTSAALDITKRVAAEAEQARLAERERIAMDLHDSVIQSLYGVTLTLGAAEALLARAPTAAAARLELAMTQLEDVIRETRANILGQQPTTITSPTLKDGLWGLAGELRATAAAPLIVTVEVADVALPAATIAHLLLITREALANARRHASASRIDLEVTRDDAALVLTIRDNGRGFEAERASEHNGQGLRNMRARAAALGGHLTIASAAGQGTEMRLTIPAGTGGTSDHDG